jgi:hypothetical protein
MLTTGYELRIWLHKGHMALGARNLAILSTEITSNR